MHASQISPAAALGRRPQRRLQMQGDCEHLLSAPEQGTQLITRHASSTG